MVVKDLPSEPIDLNPSLARWFAAIALLLAGNCAVVLLDDGLRRTSAGVVVATFDVIAFAVLMHLSWDLTWGRARAERHRRWLGRRERTGVPRR